MRSLARSSVIKYDKTTRALFDSTWHAREACNRYLERNTRPEEDRWNRQTKKAAAWKELRI